MPKLKEKIKWEDIIDAIKSNSCMLFLGPEAVTMPDGKLIHRAALEYIQDKNGIDDVTFYEGEEFLYFHRNIRQTAYMGISKFYKQQPIPSIFDAIAEIPFYFILNASPDIYLKQVFEQRNFKFHFSHYKIEDKQEEVDDISGKTPLLYNIFGTVDMPNSLIFTHDDLFRFLFSITEKGHKIHPKVASQFQNASFLIFLGFKFERWYVKLLLRLLGIHENSIEKSAMGLHQHNDNGEIESFFDRHFNVKFIESHIPEFVDELYQRCKAENLLKNFEMNKVHKEQLIDVERKLINLVNDLDISGFFEEIDKLPIGYDKKTELGLLKKEFIGGQSSSNIHYFDRLKVFAQELVR